MAAHLPRFPVLLFFFLAVHVAAAHGDPAQPQATYDASICSSSLCGSVNIRYPFYSSRKRADYSGYYYSCGYTGLEISCQDRGPTRTPVIQPGGHNYTVQNIFYDRSAIILADSDVLEPGKCPGVSHEVSLDEVWLSYNDSSDDTLTFFFGCDVGPLDGLDMYRINCNGVKSPFGDGASFVLTPDDLDKAPEQELAAYCKNLSVPVRSEALLTASNKTNFTSGGYGDVLKQGFELLWLPTEECHPCEQSGGKCYYNQHMRFLACLCSDGKVGNLNCTGHGASTASPSGNSIPPDLASFILFQSPRHALETSGCISNFHRVASLLVPDRSCARVLEFAASLHAAFASR